VKRVFCLLLPLLLFSGEALAKRNILLLHSYHRGYEWTRNIATSMEAVLTREFPDAELFVEEMDTKRLPPAQLFPQLHRFYSQKYAGFSFDVILCSDDNALDFLLTYGDELFPNVPVVFCGINRFDDSRLSGHRNYTGVVEANDYAGTLEIALTLHPDTRQVALVGDRTPTALANIQRLRAIAPHFSDRINFIELVGLSTTQLKEALASLPAETIILNCNFFKAAEGRYYSVTESNALISHNSKGPVYVFGDHGIKAGVIGGLVVSGEQQGKAAAALALRILHGEQATAIPIARASPNVYMFDYRALQRFSIDTKQLPQGSRLLNEPAAVNTAQRQKLLAAVVLATSFAGLTLWLTIARLQRTRAYKALRQSKGTLKAILGSISDPMCMMDQQRKVLWANAPARGLYGEDLVGRKCYEILHQRSEPCPGPCPALRAFAGGQIHEKQTCITDPQGRIHHLHCTANVALRDEKGAPATVLKIYRDITAMKQAQKDLHLAKYSIDSSITPFSMANLEGHLSYANRAFLDLWGYDHVEDILGRDLSYFHQNPKDVQAVIQQLGTKGSWQGEINSRRRDGSLFTAEVLAHVATDPNGVPLCLTGSFVDITDKLHSEREVQRQAYFDELTGLPNRALLADHMELAFSQARRCEEFAAVLLLDLDNFKQTNDTLGHAKGDLLLQQVALRLQSTLRKCDTLARWGGDEFVLLLTGMKSELATAKVANKILDLLTEQPFELNESEIFTSASAGIALFPRDGEDSETLLKHADIAMYEAKQDGRNDFHFFSKQMQQKAMARHRLEANMRRALRLDEFYMVYQPQVNLCSGQIVGVEALVRWQSDNLGLIPPSEFIPIAEETGLIRPLGEWILRTACQQAVSWQHANQPPLRLAVNLSVCQLRQPNLVELIDKILRETGLSPQLLELEITESVFMEQKESATLILGQLQQRGIQIAIDDFGTGYSSLSYLKNVPIDRIKIAQEFVRDIPQDPDDVAIVQAIIAMTSRLGLKQIAEGVETIDQLEFLRQHGCHDMQGYYFARPMRAEQLTDFLTKAATANLNTLVEGSYAAP
jgi:diguanylate cyclase (GGDEF)-like protein/PAS domain S-box-containing protein